MDSARSAENACAELDGRDIYQDCCTLQIDFSPQERLRVHRNGALTYDFTEDLPQDPDQVSSIMK